MKYLVIIFSITFLTSCENTKTTAKNNTEDINKAKLGEIKKDIVPTNINKAYIKNDMIYFEVSYSGGCEEQSFELIGDFYLVKTMPPKRILQLVRNNKGDACRELITQTLKFDLSEVIYNNDYSQEIIFLIEGTNFELPLHSTEEVVK